MTNSAIDSLSDRIDDAVAHARLHGWTISTGQFIINPPDDDLKICCPLSALAMDLYQSWSFTNVEQVHSTLVPFPLNEQQFNSIWLGMDGVDRGQLIFYLGPRGENFIAPLLASYYDLGTKLRARHCDEMEVGSRVGS